MKTNLLTLTLAASISASTSLAALAVTLNGRSVEQRSINQEPRTAVVVDATGNWLRISQETRQGLYLSLPAQRWIF